MFLRLLSAAVNRPQPGKETALVMTRKLPAPHAVWHEPCLCALLSTRDGTTACALLCV